MATTRPVASGHTSTWRTTSLIPVLGLMWGAGILLAKVAVDAGVPPLLFAAFEAVGIAVTALAICWVKNDFPQWTAEAIRFYAVTGFTLVVLPYSFIYSALAHITGSLASVVQAMTPVFTVVLATLLGLERSMLMRWLGVLLSFVGIFMIVQQQSGPDGLGSFSLWVLAALAAPLSYAVTNVYAARTTVEQSATAKAAGSNIVAVIGMGIVLLITTVSGATPLVPSTLTWSAIVAGLIAITANVGASLTFFRLASLGGATKAGLASYITVLVGIVSGWAVLDEPVTALACVAAAVVVGGVVMASRSPRTSQETTTACTTDGR